MANNYYTRSKAFAAGTKAKGSDVAAELDAVSAGFATLPDVDLITGANPNYVTAGGTANALTITSPTTAITTYNGRDGLYYSIKATLTNTGATTINVDGVGAVTLCASNGDTPVAGSITANGIYGVTYNETVGKFYFTDTASAGLAATASAASAVTSQTSADDSQTSADASAASVVSAQGKVDAAEDWAITPEDTLVPVGSGGNGTSDYSALHHAAKAISQNNIDDGSVSLATTYSSTKIEAEITTLENSIAASGGASAAQAANITINSFNIAVNGGMSVQNMVDGVSDVFTDETGIDTGRNVEAVYSPTGDFYYPQPVQGFDLSLSQGYTSALFDLSSQDLNHQSVRFNSDGTKFFTLGATNNRIFEYTCSVGFDLSSTVAYSGNSFLLSGQVTGVSSLAFNNDGTKFFVGGGSNTQAHEYTCSIGFDLSSTVAYSGNSVTLETNVFAGGLAFNLDGTKFFSVDSINNRVYEYTLSTGFDFGSTFAYSGNSFSVISQTNTPLDIAFNSDGKKFFVCTNGTEGDKVFEYTCSIGFDLSSTVAYSGNSIDVSSQSLASHGLAFNNNGTKLFIVDQDSDDIFEYSLGAGSASGDGALITVANTALAAPDESFVVIHEEDVDSVTISTDLSAWVSRTAVSTYTTLAASDNKLRLTAHGFTNGERLILTTPTGDNFPTGLDGITAYYVVNKTTNDFEVSLTSGGAVVAITADNGGTQNVTDYGQAVLTADATLSTGRILTGTADLSTQASGTAIHTILLTDNGNLMKIHALSTQWS